MTIESELRALRNDEGLYNAKAITEWARGNPNSELHQYAEYHWDDDTRAATLYRVGITRKLIRIYVLRDDGTRGTISLLQDRKTGGGYRDIEPVLTNSDLRAMALRQALRELHIWQEKYRHLRELAAVFEAIPPLLPSAA